MRRFLFGTALVALGWIAANVTTTSAQAPAARPRVLWEYTVQSNTNFFKQNLDQEGREGWELVSTNFSPNGEAVAVFKRQVQ